MQTTGQAPTRRTMTWIAMACVCLVTALLLGEATGGGGGIFVAFGPQRVVRAAGKPTTVTTTFTVRNPAATYTLHLSNGGVQGELARVSSAVVTLNGVQVVRPNDLQQTVASLTIPVTLSSTNTLSVELRSQPGSGVGLQVVGVDTDLPRLTVTSPISGTPLPAPTVQVTGTVSDLTSGIAGVTCNGVAAVVTGEAFRCTLTLGEGAQTILVQATDLAGHQATARVEVSVASPNQAPVARAGAGQTVAVGQRVTLDASASTDTDGDPLAYAWAFVMVPTGSRAVLDDPALVRPSFVVDRPGHYVVQLVVHDGWHDSAPATVTVTTRNSPPVADAGPAQTVSVGATVQLDGSHSSDVDGDALAFTWDVLTHPPTSTAALSTPDDVRPTLVIDKPGTYVVQLTVHDGVLSGTPATVSLTTQNSPPVADAGPDQSVFVGDTVALDGQLSRDVDGDALTFRWAFLARPSGSLATLTDPTLVNPTFVVDQPGLYVAQLSVHDGQAVSAPDTVSVTTQNSRPVADAGPDQSVFVGDTVALDGRLSHDADGDALQYRWSLSTTPPGSLASLSDVRAATPSFDVDFPGLYVAQLLVTDGHLDSAPDTVRLSTQNRPPVAQAGAEQSAVLGATVHLDGRTSHDPDGDALTYTWTLPVRPAGSTAALTAATTSTPMFVVDQPGTYQAQLSVHDGTVASPFSTVTITVAAPPAPLEAQQITVESQSDGQVTVTGQAPPGPADRRVTATNGRTGQRVTVTLAPDGRFTLSLAAQAGDPLALVVTDAAGGRSAPTTVTVTSGPPPDLSLLAPPLSTTSVTPFVEATAFLYTGPSPLQRGVAPGTIEARRAAVVRGTVLDRAGAPVPGVTITIKDHPEFGETHSRANGMFDLAVNGGGLLTVQYTKDGSLPVQRQVQAPWQNYVVADDVVLLPLDPQVTSLVPNASLLQVAQGSPSTDADGTRQATLLFLPGTSAGMRLADGTMQALSSLHVRATEYTVGPSGPRAMPGPLPPSSGYTYAVELSVDEALAAGATRVDFSQPVPVYVDNFLHFPVGSVVPVGWYDRERAAWIPSDNGRVIRLLGTEIPSPTIPRNPGGEESGSAEGGEESGGSGDPLPVPLAVLDIDGSGQPATVGAMYALGIGPVERAHLATRYPAGSSLWRVAVTHFTPWDLNWPVGPPDDAEPPPPDAPKTCLEDQPDPDDSNECGGCRIEAQSQTLGEDIALTGTSMYLHYRSDRMPGLLAARAIPITLSGASVPASLQRIVLEVEVAGRKIVEFFPPRPNQTYVFVWDGRDAYGREVTGTQTARIKIAYAYTLLYLAPGTATDSASRVFGRASASGAVLSIDREGQGLPIWRTWQTTMRTDIPSATAIGGWSLSPHHVYDPQAGIFYGGDGARRRAWNILRPLGEALDRNRFAWRGDDGPATRAALAAPIAVAVGPDGSVYFTSIDDARVRRVGPDGTITTVAGDGQYGFSGDGGPATQAQLSTPYGLAIAPDGTLYIADSQNNRVRRVSPDGIITTVAGDGTDSFRGDGGPAIRASLHSPYGLALGPDGSLYIADSENFRIRRVGPDGIITTVAGDGHFWFRSADELATEASLIWPRGVAYAADGSLYITDAYPRIQRVGPDGVITTVAGGGLSGFSGDGGPALQARLWEPTGLAAAADGTLYIVDQANARIRQITPNGRITTVAGNGLYGFSGDGGLATQAHVLSHSVAVAPDGSLYLADPWNRRIRRVGPTGVITTAAGRGASADSTAPNPTPTAGVSLSDFAPGEHAIVSPEGTLLYHFNAAGQHLRTIDLVSGKARDTFGYDPAGRLLTVTDGNGQSTRIERDSSGKPSALVAPGGQRTVFTTHPEGYLATVTNPAGEMTQMDYTPGGLLTAFTTPRGYRNDFTYNIFGQLVRDTNAMGGGWTIARTPNVQGYTTSMTSAEGRTSTFVVEPLPTGERRLVAIAPDGTQQERRFTIYGQKITTAPDGTVTHLEQGPHPLFGMQAPVPQLVTITTPAGLTATATTVRTSTSGDIFNPLVPRPHGVSDRE